ncbi:glutathione peroxidase [Ornithinimicrobium ciconiae]|uniref:Glutathione peroxidase n=1 Tax=Ornithinimicrobium ciconiae TaxID=2594265 RepID=A0A516G5Z9_9MICO|nr:glutathione peroxidase [Ornithinimicrobium ciconiae]QDO86951.1 glutathione peroxidase [Ornithinimicrobium ciconiae]
MSLYDIPLSTLDGRPATLREFAGRTLLLVNTASRCGMTPQYAGLERLQETYAEKGLTVVGFPCNQFGGQEPGTAEEIQTFCATTYGVTFPMMDKVEVNGPGQHPLFAELTAVPDAEGRSGEVGWNFEKWLIDPSGLPVTRFRSRVEPESAEIVAAIQAQLPAGPDEAGQPDQLA